MLGGPNSEIGQTDMDRCRQLICWSLVEVACIWGDLGCVWRFFPGVQETQARLRVELKYQDSLELLTYSLQNLILTGQSSCNDSGGMFAFESLQSWRISFKLHTSQFNNASRCLQLKVSVTDRIMWNFLRQRQKVILKPRHRSSVEAWHPWPCVLPGGFCLKSRNWMTSCFLSSRAASLNRVLLPQSATHGTRPESCTGDEESQEHLRPEWFWMFCFAFRSHWSSTFQDSQHRVPRSLCCAEYAKGKSYPAFTWERDVSCCGNERLMEFEGPVIFILWDGSFVVQKHRWNVTWPFWRRRRRLSLQQKTNVWTLGVLWCFARRLNMIELPWTTKIIQKLIINHWSSRSRMIRMIEMCHVESGLVAAWPRGCEANAIHCPPLLQADSMNFGHLWTRTVGTTSEKYQQDSTKGYKRIQKDTKGT